MNIKYVVKTTCPQGFFPDRKLDFRLSRYALRELCGCDNLEIKNHHHLIERPKTLVSLSHTKNLACAATCEDSSILSIGIDIEWASRQCKAGVERFFLRDEDDQSYSLMDIWIIKEAGFKALFPLYRGEKTLVLKDLIVKGQSIIFANDIIAEFNLNTQKADEKEYKICVCALTKYPNA